jgi:hypothetical protein
LQAVILLLQQQQFMVHQAVVLVQPVQVTTLGTMAVLEQVHLVLGYQQQMQVN